MFNKNNTSSYQYNKDDIDKLYHHNVHTFWSTLILSSLFVVILWFYSPVTDQNLLIWYLLLNIISAIRLKVNNQPKEVLTEEKTTQYNQWVNKYLLLTTAMSAIWGLAGFHFFPVDNPYIASSLILMLLAVLITMTSLVLVSTFAIYAQATLLVLPILVRLLINSPENDVFFVVLATITNAVTIIISAYFLIQTLQSLRQSKYELQNKINQDALTGLANKRAFERTFRNEWRRAMRSEKPLSILIIDVDDFKEYVGLTGLQLGNNCLINIAKEIQVVARRPADISARTEGDRFAVLLPGTGIHGAEIVANRLRAYIQNLCIRFPDRPDDRFITVCIGLSSCQPVHPETNNTAKAKDVLYPAMLFNQAEYALQKAKEQGINHCVTETCGINSMSVDIKRKLDSAAKRNKKA